MILGGSGAERSIPLSTVVFSGHRYVVMADLGLPRRVPLILHGNARVHLSLVHAVAEQLLGAPVAKVDDYGYTPRGRGMIDVPVLHLDGAVFDRLTAVPVFDFTDEADPPVQGMLGTRFLVAARAAVDFTRDTLLLGVAAASQPDAGLVERGYRHLAMRVSDSGRVTVDAFFPALGREIAITPSTVSVALTLDRRTFEGHVAMTRTAEPDRSPSGTSPDVFTSHDVGYELGGMACNDVAVLEDLAEYATVAEGELDSLGMLGYDWMCRHAAILDYANRRLYFLP